MLKALKVNVPAYHIIKNDLYISGGTLKRKKKASQL